MAKTIGIFGGAFDPVHVGHTSLISDIQKIIDFEKIFIIPGLRKEIIGMWSFKIPIWPSYDGMVTSVASDLKIDWSGLIISTKIFSDIISYYL